MVFAYVGVTFYVWAELLESVCGFLLGFVWLDCP
jgi:hypothetical protein